MQLGLQTSCELRIDGWHAVLRAFRYGCMYEADGAQDVYSAAVTLFWLCSARPMHEVVLLGTSVMTPTEVFDHLDDWCQRYNGPPDDLLKCAGLPTRNSYTEQFVQLLRQCMAWDPKLRPTAQAMEAQVGTLILQMDADAEVRAAASSRMICLVLA